MGHIRRPCLVRSSRGPPITRTSWGRRAFERYFVQEGIRNFAANIRTPKQSSFSGRVFESYIYWNTLLVIHSFFSCLFAIFADQSQWFYYRKWMNDTLCLASARIRNHGMFCRVLPCLQGAYAAYGMRRVETVFMWHVVKEANSLSIELLDSVTHLVRDALGFVCRLLLIFHPS